MGKPVSQKQTSAWRAGQTWGAERVRKEGKEMVPLFPSGEGDGTKEGDPGKIKRGNSLAPAFLTESSKKKKH